MKKKGVYAGSFDPVTNGHMWMIREGARLFDEFIVVLGINPEKNYTFTMEERFSLLKESTGEIENVQIDTMENRYLVSYAAHVGANYILRGIRSEGDYSFERVMRYINGDMNNKITTIFLMPPREIAEVSSSMVKSLIGPEGWQDVIKNYVPEAVYINFMKKFTE